MSLEDLALEDLCPCASAGRKPTTNDHVPRKPGGEQPTDFEEMAQMDNVVCGVNCQYMLEITSNVLTIPASL